MNRDLSKTLKAVDDDISELVRGSTVNAEEGQQGFVDEQGRDMREYAPPSQRLAAQRPSVVDVRLVLRERAKTHGEFTDQAGVSQSLKRIAANAPNWSKLSDIQKEALEMILHKISRVLVGNPDERDHFDDISGYATLVADRVVPRT